MRPPEHRASAFTTREVRAHYDALAPTYSARANQVCRQQFRQLADILLPDTGTLLELGGGSEPLLARFPNASRVACDLSACMLQAAPRRTDIHYAAADAAMLPFRDTAFDAVLAVNLLEHAPLPDTVFQEAARVLRPGGRALFITPNGNLSPLLHLLEALHLKLPEGPHRYLTFNKLAQLPGTAFSIRQHMRLLPLPLPGVSNLANRLPLGRFGLFQYLLLEKRSPSIS